VRKNVQPDFNKAFGGLYWMVTGKPSSILEIKDYQLKAGQN
jgi:hypothetical protein